MLGANVIVRSPTFEARPNATIAAIAIPIADFFCLMTRNPGDRKLYVALCSKEIDP